jgi:nicotinamidase/pyrazinamidase
VDREHLDDIAEIIVTLDTHRKDHIAHAVFWTNGNGEEPKPFQRITHSDVKTGIWQPKDPSLLVSYDLYCQLIQRKANVFIITIFIHRIIVSSILQH